MYDLALISFVYNYSTYYRLFQSNDAYDKGHGIDGGYGQLEGVVGFVVGHDEYAVGGGTGFDAFDECALIGIDDVDFVPLEKEVGHGYALAGNDVARGVFGIHAGAFDGYEEVGSLEYGDDVAFAFESHD